MSVYLDTVNLDEIFNQLSTPPVIVNSIDVSTKEEKDRLNDMLISKYDGDSLETLPSCRCGFWHGEHLKGTTCPNCGGEVTAATERPIESLLWIACPANVDALMNPHVYLMLESALRVTGFSTLEWLTNTGYKFNRVPKQVQKFIDRYPIQRGYNFFIRNFDNILNGLLECGVVKGDKQERWELMEFVRRNRENIFVQNLPIPSKVGFITESTATGTYADLSMMYALDAIQTITGIESGPIRKQQYVIENSTIRAISQLAMYYDSFYSKSLNPKAGWFRKQIYGCRSHFSFRAVISSLSCAHTYDEIHMPWSLSVMLLKVHISSKLRRRIVDLNDPLRRKYTVKQATSRIMESVMRYDPLIDEIMMELIHESPVRGFPVILQRNPTLKRGSAQALRITHIKKDPNINTISMSTLCLNAPNADFDGDMLNGLLILDMDMWRAVKRLEPHHGVLDLNTPRSLSNNIALPSPVLETINKWMDEPINYH